MGEIISGQVFFSKTVKTGDFENEKADCRLDFNVAEGETCDSILSTASATAKAKVFEMLGKGKAPNALPAQLAKPAEPAKEPAGGASAGGATKADLTAAAANAAGAPKSGTAEAAPKKAVKPPKVEAPKEEPKKAEPDAATDDLADLLGAAPEPVADADLVAHVTKTNGRIKDPAAIKALTGKYVQPPKGVIDVPQEVRRKYMAELDALQPKTAG